MVSSLYGNVFINKVYSSLLQGSEAGRWSMLSQIIDNGVVLVRGVPTSEDGEPITYSCTVLLWCGSRSFIHSFIHSLGNTISTQFVVYTVGKWSTLAILSYTRLLCGVVEYPPCTKSVNI